MGLNDGHRQNSVKLINCFVPCWPPSVTWWGSCLDDKSTAETNMVFYIAGKPTIWIFTFISHYLNIFITPYLLEYDQQNARNFWSELRTINCLRGLNRLRPLFFYEVPSIRHETPDPIVAYRNFTGTRSCDLCIFGSIYGTTNKSWDERRKDLLSAKKGS